MKFIKESKAVDVDINLEKLEELFAKLDVAVEKLKKLNTITRNSLKAAEELDKAVNKARVTARSKKW